MKQVSDDNPDFVAFSVDHWSAMCHGYFGIICYYLHQWSRKVFHVYCQPDDESHTGDHIRGVMEEHLRE